MTPEEAAEQLDDVWNVDPDAYYLNQGVAQPINASNLDGEDEPATFGPPVKLPPMFYIQVLSIYRDMISIIHSLMCFCRHSC